MDSKRMNQGGFTPIVALVLAMAMMVASQPVMDEKELKNIAYQEKGVVANIQGYVELVSKNYTRESLDFTDIRQFEYRSEPNTKHISLIGEQFEFSFVYVHQNEGTSEGHYQFNYLKMGIKNPPATMPLYSVRCLFEQEFTVALPDKSRYSCTKEQTHRCSWDGELVANVVLRSFELELDGNFITAEKLEFSKPAWAESCERWSK